MGLILQYEYGQTPLEEAALDGLKIPAVGTRAELDEQEQQNIEEALLWIRGRKWPATRILTEQFIKALHEKMLGRVWKWAGRFRQTDKNIGVAYYEVPVALRQLLGDALCWIDHAVYPPEEIAIRFKHRLVAIHCFPNGNGRHSRLMADIIIEKLFTLPVFSWGARQSERDPAQIRLEYIQTVKAGDTGDIAPLLAFART